MKGYSYVWKKILLKYYKLNHWENKFLNKKKNEKYMSQNYFWKSIYYLKITDYMYLSTIQGSVHWIVNVEKKTTIVLNRDVLIYHSLKLMDFFLSF